MMSVMNKDLGVAVDCEHRVQFNGRGMRVKEWKVGLIQFAYFNKNTGDRMQFLFVRTHKLKRLPGNVVTFFQHNSFNIVGVNLGGDLSRIGKGFGIERAIAKRKKETIINLGLFARVRDVVQNGTVGMKRLIEIVLKLRIEKRTEDIFLNFKTETLSPAQLKCALIDVKGVLKVGQIARP